MKIGVVELVCPSCQWPEFQTAERWKGNAKNAARWRRKDYLCARCGQRAAVQRGDDASMIFLPPLGSDKGRWRAVCVKTGEQRHAKARSRLEQALITDQASSLLASRMTERKVIQTLCKDYGMAGETARKYVRAAKRRTLEARARRKGLTPEQMYEEDMDRACEFYEAIIRKWATVETSAGARLTLAAIKQFSLLRFGPYQRRRPVEPPVQPVIGRVVIVQSADTRPEDEESCEALSTPDDE